VSEALATIPTVETALVRPHPREVIQMATEEANVLSEVIERQKLYSMIQGKKFVKVEGWVTLATLRGCLPREVSVEEKEGGRYVATVELCRMSDGMVLTRASAECGGDGDNVWKGRPSNARRSMAITRATGKAARVAFSWVMALAGFEVTPLEEMDHLGNEQSENPAPPKQWPASGVAPPSRSVSAEPVWRGKIVNMESKHGETKGKPWVLYTMTGSDGTKFGTFSDTIAAGLMKLDGRFIEIIYSQTAKGNLNVEEYRDVTKDEAPFAIE